MNDFVCGTFDLIVGKGAWGYLKESQTSEEDWETILSIWWIGLGVI